LQIHPSAASQSCDYTSYDISVVLTLTDCRARSRGPAEPATPGAFLHCRPVAISLYSSRSARHSCEIATIKTGRDGRVNGQFMNRPRHDTSEARPRAAARIGGRAGGGEPPSQTAGKHAGSTFTYEIWPQMPSSFGLVRAEASLGCDGQAYGVIRVSKIVSVKPALSLR